MATVLSNIYPPLIDTFMPAFPYNGPARVTFSISPYNSLKSIKRIHVSLVNQKTNQNAFAGKFTDNTIDSTTLVNGIWILPCNTIENILYIDTDTNTFDLTIPPILLKSQENNSTKTFLLDSYYKLQIRFDSNEQEDLSNIQSDYLTKYRPYFSEWSGVCLLKAIPQIDLVVRNFNIQTIENYNSIIGAKVPQYVPGTIPISVMLQYFDGNTSTPDTDTGGATIISNKATISKNTEVTNNHGEYLKAYQITITDESNNVYDDSGLIYVKPGEINKHSFTYLLDTQSWRKFQNYAVNIKIITNNNYEYNNNNGKDFKNKLQFQLIDYAFQFHPTFNFKTVNRFAYGIDYEDIVTEEDGKVEFTLKVQSEEGVGPGYLFIKRGSSLDNFKKWTIIDCTFFENTDQEINHTIVDDTISSLVQYQYSAQWMLLKGARLSSIAYSKKIYPNFHDILLSRNGRQLAIRYNAQISNLSIQKTRVKIDTLGGRYPKFAENAKMKYKQFSLSGLLTAESDFNRTFLNDLDYLSANATESSGELSMDIYDQEMNGQYIIRNDTTVESKSLNNGQGTYANDISKAQVGGTTVQIQKKDTQIATSHDLYPKDNWWWERLFREEALEWLNDGEPKLYRSMTEGNLIVMLDGISLTPNAQLGRRIWNFSCTVYEVGDGNNIELLNSLGIYPIENQFEEDKLEGISTDIVLDTSRELRQLYCISWNDFKEKHSSYKQDSNSQNALKVVNYIIEPDIKNRRLGDGGNYTYVDNSIELQDLKITFQSKPQWYNLDTLQVKYSVSNIDKTLIVHLIGEDKDIERTVQSDFTLEELLEMIKDYEENNNKLERVELDLGNKTEIINGTEIDISKGEPSDLIIDAFFEKNDKDRNYGLGYKLKIDFAPNSSSASFVTRTIFVNEHGYYQIPSNMIVKEVYLYDDEVAILDFLLSYKIKYDDTKDPDKIEIADKIVGQIGGWWQPGTNISNIVNKKYEYYDNDKNNEIVTRQELQYWTAFGFSTTSYAQFSVRYIDQPNTTKHLVGRTGILNLQTDFPIEYCIVEGRRMVQVNKNRQPYLDEWEYVIDDSVYDWDQSEDEPYGDYWWNLIDEDGNSEDTLIRVRYLYSTDAEITDDAIYVWDVDDFRDVYNDWHSLETINYSEQNKYMIEEPKINTVYGVIDENGIFSYKLYYIDHAWYDVKFEDNEKTTMIARVPINGLINYRGTLLRKYWTNTSNA